MGVSIFLSQVGAYNQVAVCAVAKKVIGIITND